VDELTKPLSLLKTGERCWFWFCPQIVDPNPILLVQPFQTDPTMEKLQATASSLSPPMGAFISMGIMSVDLQGQLTLGGPGLTRRHLAQLASWADRHTSAHPALARLKNTTFINLNSSGEVQAVHKAPNLWSNLPDIVLPGTLAETAMRLGKLSVGRSCWFWLARNGPSDKPFLSLHPAKKDPQGAEFAKAVVLLRRQASRRGVEIRGLLRKIDPDSVLLITTDAIDEGHAILQELGEENADLKAALSACILIRTHNGRFAEVVLVGDDAADVDAVVGGLDLSGQVAALDGLADAGSKALFWFGISAEDDTPLLLLSTDRDALKGAVKGAGKASKSVRGQVVRSKKGWLEFRTRTPYPGFITALGGWCRAHRPQWPALKALTGARMICRNADGEIVDRQKNDTIWND